MECGFLNYLDATEIGEYNGRAVWRLNASLDFRLDKYRLMHVPAGFETDLASVPRLPLIYMIWGDRAHREAVLHDYMYRIDAIVMFGSKLSPISKEDADWYFRRAMISESLDVGKIGQPYYVYQPMYLAVRMFAGGSFHRMRVMDHFPLD